MSWGTICVDHARVRQIAQKKDEQQNMIVEDWKKRENHLQKFEYVRVVSLNKAAMFKKFVFKRSQTQRQGESSGGYGLVLEVCKENKHAHATENLLLSDRLISLQILKTFYLQDVTVAYYDTFQAAHQDMTDGVNVYCDENPVTVYFKNSDGLQLWLQDWEVAKLVSESEIVSYHALAGRVEAEGREAERMEVDLEDADECCRFLQTFVTDIEEVTNQLRECNVEAPVPGHSHPLIIPCNSSKSRARELGAWMMEERDKIMGGKKSAQ